MALPPHLDRAYRRSRYVAAGVELKVGRRSAALDGLLLGLGVRDAVLITAWNPGSRRMPRPWNEKAMGALRCRLGSTPSLPAVGAGHGWSEESLLVAGDTRRFAALGRRFRQAALVVVRRGARVALVPLV